MKTFIAFSAIMAVAFARPGVQLAAPHVGSLVPLAYKLVPGAPIGLDGRVVDTPEVAFAKAEHAAAHINERNSLANEVVRSAHSVVNFASPVVHTAENVFEPAFYAARLVPGAPLGVDGRVVDTPEVAHAKAEHAAAHINEKIGLAQEAAKTASYQVPLLVSSYSAPLSHGYLY